MVDRLSVLDASFLRMESATVHMHVGGLGIFSPGLEHAAVLATLRDRLEAVPRARMRVVVPPRGGGRPYWADDPDFDLTYHVRHAALPAPGTMRQLGEFLARLVGRHLDRDRPLWELYVIEGLEHGRVALFRKVSLAMASGDGHDPFAVLLDATPDGPGDPSGFGRWHARARPRTTDVYVDAAIRRGARALDVGRATAEVLTDPRRVGGVAAAVGRSAVGLAGRVRPPVRSPLSRRLTPHRRFATAQLDLARIRLVRRAFGGAVNDVVVAVVGDAVGRLLRHRGHDTKDLDLTVVVPVRVHDHAPVAGIGSGPTVGEGVVGVLAPLPVMDMDPVARLYRVMGEMAGLKESRQAVAADQLMRVAGYGPSALHALAARVASAHQRHHVALSNAPGPQEPRYLAGTVLEETYPFVPLAGEATLSIAVSSYAGGMYVGLLGDRDAVFDLPLLPAFLDEAVAELAGAAVDAEASGRRG